MAGPTRSWRQWRARILGAVAGSLFLSLGLGALSAQTQPVVAASTAAAAPAPVPSFALADCLRIALEQQPALAAHRASLAAADAQYRGLEKLHTPILLARDLPIRRKQACLGVTVAEAGLNQAEWETVYAVTRTYFGVVYARQQLRVATDLTASLRFYQERVRDLVNKGESKEWTTSTVDKITVYLRLAEVRQAEAARGIERANAALREAMGVAPDTRVQVAEQALPSPTVEVSRAQTVALALARRGELVQASTAAEVVELEVRAQGTTFWPTTRTFASVVDIHARAVPQGIINSEYRPGATSLEMPPNFAGPRSFRIARAEDLSARAAAVVDKTRNLIALDAEDVYLKWEEASRKVPASQDAERAGSRLAKNTREDFRAAQRVKIEEILTNEVLAAQAAAGYNEALYQLLIALADLQRVTAGGFDAGFGTPDPACGTRGTPAPR